MTIEQILHEVARELCINADIQPMGGNGPDATKLETHGVAMHSKKAFELMSMHGLSIGIRQDSLIVWGWNKR